MADGQISAFPEPGTEDPLRAPSVQTPDYGSGLSAFPPDTSRLSQAMGQALTTAPDTAARVFDLRLKTGLPADVIERNLDDVEKQVASSSFDPETFRKQSPALASWLEQHPLNAAVAKDDLVPLQGMERALRFGRNTVGALPAGVFRFGQGAWATVQQLAELLEEPAPTDGLNRMVGQVPPELPPAGQVAKGTVNLYAQPKVYNADGTISTVDSLSVNIDGKEVLLPTVTPEGRHFTGTEDEVTEQAIAEYQKTGRHLGIFATPEAANAYAEKLHEDYAAGVYDQLPMSRRIAAFARGSQIVAAQLAEKFGGDRRDAGFVEQAIYSGVESIGQMIPSIALGVLAGPEAALGSMGVTTSGQAYAQAREQGVTPATASLFGGFQGLVEVATEWIPAHKLFTNVAAKMPIIQTIAHQIVPEIATEEIATALQDFGEWAVLPSNKDRTIGDYLRERPSAAAMTALSTLVTVGGTAVAAHGASRAFEQLGIAAEQSKTVQRSPEAAQAFLAHATQDVTHVYAPIDSFTEYWQSKGVNPADIATELTGDPAAYRTAVDLKQDLAIPTAAYVTKLAGTEHNAFFQNELRLHPDEENAREAEAREAQTIAQLTEPAEASPAERVRADVQAQLEAAGASRSAAQYQARLYEDAFGRWAAETGIDVPTLATRYGLTIAQEGLAAGEVATQPPIAAGTTREAPPSARFIGYQPTAEGGSLPLYTITGGPHDRSTVSGAKLSELGIAAPADVPTPETYFRERARVAEQRSLAQDEQIRQAQRVAEVDAKTGVANSNAFERAKPAADADPNVAFASFDLNNFKAVNDALGHEVGDEALKRAAAAIKQAAGEFGFGERVFRPGGDEFVVLASPDVIDQIRDRAEELVGTQDMGGVLFSVSGTTGPTYKAADDALQARKRARKAAAGAEATPTPQEFAQARRATPSTATPAFKNWFGDWELARLKSALRPVRGSDQAKAAAKEFLRQPLTNRETGLVATVSGESLGKMLSKSAVDRSVSPQAHLLAVGNLDHLFPLAMTRETRPSRGTDDVAAIHHFDVPMPFEDRVLRVKILAKSFRTEATGARLYLVSAVEVMSAPASIGGFSTPSHSRAEDLAPPAGVLDDRFTRMVAAVKGEGVSAVVDNEGKPLPVYHGSNRTFDIFEHRAAMRLVEGQPTEVMPQAFFFTPDQTSAQRFARDRALIDERLRGRDRGQPEVRSFYLSVHQPLELVSREHATGMIPSGEGVAELEDITGQTFEYWEEVQTALDDPNVIDELRMRGYDGVHLLESDETEAWAVFEPEQIKSTENIGAFDPTSPNVYEQRTGETLGSITFGPEGPSFAKVVLAAKADLSTFLHESGHYFVEVMADLVARGEASPRMRADLETLLRSAGYEGDIATWRALPADERRAAHEHLAQALEVYLQEGKAPSVALRPAFARFRAWLLSIYRNIRLDVTLSAEVRSAFDRLFASDAAIAEAQQQGNQRPLWLTPELAGMSPDQFEKYRDRIADASQKARERLDQQLLAEVRREQTAQWKAQRAAIEETVTSEVHAQPVYRALAAILKGTNPDGTPLVEGTEPEPIKLSREAIVEQFGEDRVKTLPRGLTTREDSGVHPDLIAETYGFSSGDELLTAISQAPKMADVIQQETDRRMLAEHGSMLLDGTLPEKAQAATANDAREAVIEAELTQLAKIRKGGPARIRAALPRADRVRTFAKERIAATRVSEVRPQVFWAAARRAAAQAVELAAKQDIDGTIVAKQQELVNIALYKEAMRAQADVEARVQRARDLGKGPARQRLGLAGESYLDQVDGILDRYEFARVSQKALERRASLRKWAAALEGEGLPVDFPEELLDEARRVNYRELTVEQLLGVTDSLDHIAHLARLKNKLLKAADQRDFAAARDGVVASIVEHNEPQKLPLEFRPSDDKWRKVSAWFASHAKIAMLARVLDGHQDGGAMWEAFIRPINAAADAEVTRQNETGTAYHAILQEHYPGRELARLNDKQHIPAINDSLSKEGRLAVALNWGNQTSRDRLLNDPARRWSQPQVEAILDTLDARDWKFVQDTWDFLDKFWPEIEAKQRRVTGIAPEKVDAIPVRTKFGELRGGYYPLAYEGRLNAQARGFEPATEAKLATSAAYVRSTTRRGHVEARQQNVQLSVRLDLGVAFQHLDQVIHDLTHHEMLIDTTRLLRDRQIAGALYESKALLAKGDLLYQQFSSALQDIALGSRGNGKASVIDTAATFLRTRTQIAGMAWNLWTALQQPLGLFNGMSRVGPQWVAKGVKRWLRDAASMENTASWIADVSPMMRERVQTATQDLHDVRQALRQPGGWFDTLVRTVSADRLTQQTILDGYLWHIGMAQRVADIPTWLGAYEKHMAGGETEARAIALADQAVLDSQGGGQIKDLAQIQRGSPVARLFMTFFSYGNTVYNATAERAAATSFKSPSQVLTFLGHLTLLGIMPAVLTEALRCATGRGQCRDWPDYLGNVAGQYLGDGMNMMVGLREFGGAVKIATGLDPGTRGYEGPAALRPIQLAYQLAQQIHQGQADEAFFKALNQVGGLAFKYPAAQVQRTIDGFVALEHGKTHNPLALLFGAPPKKAGAR